MKEILVTAEAIVKSAVLRRSAENHNKIFSIAVIENTTSGLKIIHGKFDTTWNPTDTCTLYLHNPLYPTIPSYCTDFRQSFVLLEQGETTRGYYQYAGLSFPIEFDPFKKRPAIPDTPLPKLKSELIIRFSGRTGDRIAKLTAILLHLSDEEKTQFHSHSSIIPWNFPQSSC